MYRMSITRHCAPIQYAGVYAKQYTVANLLGPSKTVMFFEAIAGSNSAGWNYDLTESPENPSLPYQRTPASNGACGYGSSHNNVAYDDGAGNSAGGGSQTGYVPVTGVLGNVPTCTFPMPASGSSLALTGSHSDGSNFLFCDGHVKWLQGQNVSTGFDAANATDDQLNFYDSPTLFASPSAQRAAGTSSTNPAWQATFSKT